MDTSLDGFGRFAEAAHQLMRILVESPQDASAIRRNLRIAGDREARPGLMFGSIARLESQALIEAEVGDGDVAQWTYRLTPLGAATLDAQVVALPQSDLARVRRSNGSTHR